MSERYNRSNSRKQIPFRCAQRFYLSVRRSLAGKFVLDGAEIRAYGDTVFDNMDRASLLTARHGHFALKYLSKVDKLSLTQALHTHYT